MYGRYKPATPPPKKSFLDLLTPRRVALALFLLLLFGGGSAAFLYFALQQPPKAFHIPLPGGDDEDAVARSQGYKNIEALIRTDKAALMLTTGADNTPILTLVFHHSADWSKQSLYIQKGMCLYLQWLIPQAQSLPSGFIPQGRDNPRYQEIAHNVQGSLCRSCWGVTDSSERFFVAGDGAWKSLENPSGVETWIDMRRRTESQ